MDSLVGQAMKYAEDKKQNEDVEEFGEPQISIVGIGGAGNNTVNRLHKLGVKGARSIAVNTDKQHLGLVEADHKILIGRAITKGLGAGGYPEVGQRCAELSRTELEDALKGSDLVFITAGMGGGTGTGSSPIIAEIAKQQGAIVVGMVSSPFAVERARLFKADGGLESLRRKCDTVIVLDNNKLLKFVPNLPIDQAFSVMDQLIAETVKGIAETISLPSLINLDYADMRSVMKRGGVAMMLYGESKAQDKSKRVVHDALNHPLLDVDYRGASGALIHITGGPDLTLKEAEDIAQQLTYELDSKADVIWGARIVPEYEGTVKVMAIMTGITSPNVLGPNGQNRPISGKYFMPYEMEADKEERGIPWVE